jgi:hypothetical protein
MNETFPVHAFIDPGCTKKVYGALLKHTGPNSAEYMITTLTFQNNRIYPMKIKNLRQK